MKIQVQYKPTLYEQDLCKEFVCNHYDTHIEESVHNYMDFDGVQEDVSTHEICDQCDEEIEAYNE